MSDDIEEQLRQKEDEYEALKQEYEEYQGTFKAETARSVEAELEQELEKLITQNFELEREAKGLRARVSEAQVAERTRGTGGALDELKENLKRIKLERDKLELRNEDLEDELFRLKKGLVGAVSNKMGPSLEVELELSDLKQENEDLRRKLYEGSSTTNIDQIALLEEELEKAKLNLVRAKEAEIEADFLRSKLERTTEELAELKEEYEKALDELAIEKSRGLKKRNEAPQMDLISRAIEEHELSRESSKIFIDVKTEVSDNYENRSAEDMLHELLGFVTHNLKAFKNK